jgi:transcriptional regulator with XRE-family HTH domain
MQVDFEHVKMAVALRTARAAVGWSQDELARVTGIPKTTIARFETMEGGLKAAQLATLINTYNSKGIDVEFLRGNKVTIKIDEDALRSSGQRMTDGNGRRSDRRKKLPTI